MLRICYTLACSFGGCKSIPANRISQRHSFLESRHVIVLQVHCFWRIRMNLIDSWSSCWMICIANLLDILWLDNRDHDFRPSEISTRRLVLLATVASRIFTFILFPLVDQLLLQIIKAKHVRGICISAIISGQDECVELFETFKLLLLLLRDGWRCRFVHIVPYSNLKLQALRIVSFLL